MSEQQVTRAPSDLVRPLHSILATQLGLPSPLEPAVKVLDRAAALGFARQTGVGAARLARADLARRIALGEVPFDAATIAAYDEGRIWVSDGHVQAIPAATALAEEATRQAQAAAGGMMAMHAPGIFDALA